MVSVVPIMCRACVHVRPGTDGCAAFPDGIPVDIAMSGVDHRLRHQGDHGIQFQQADGVEAAQAFADWQRVFGGNA